MAPHQTAPGQAPLVTSDDVPGPVVKEANHKWMIVVCATPLVIAGVAAAVSFLGPSEPSVAVSAPAGYQAVSDAYFGYAIPTAWKENDSATTDTGDYYYAGADGWAGETLTKLSTPPTITSAGPAVLGVFGTARAQPYTLTGGHAVSVPGTTLAWSYQLVRGGTVTATVIDAWASSSSTQLWLAVHADATTTATVVASLRA